MSRRGPVEARILRTRAYTRDRAIGQIDGRTLELAAPSEEEDEEEEEEEQRPLISARRVPRVSPPHPFFFASSALSLKSWYPEIASILRR